LRGHDARSFLAATAPSLDLFLPEQPELRRRPRRLGERSAIAVQAAQDAGLSAACHIQGGVDAWKKAKGRVVG
jgi:hypothetical protein